MGRSILDKFSIKVFNKSGMVYPGQTEVVGKAALERIEERECMSVLKLYK